MEENVETPDSINPQENPEIEEPQVVPDEKSLRQYWFFLAGQLFSLLGSSVVQFAIIWWLTVTAPQGRQGIVLGLASMAGFLPFVLTSLFAGVLVDRWNRKVVIASADGLQAFFTVLLMLLFYIDLARIEYVLIILAIRAVAQGFHNPAQQAIIPIMVPRDKLTTVNSFQYLFNGIIFAIGPVVGALLIEWLGIDSMATILWVDIITFLAAVIPVLLIHIPDITKKKREAPEKASFRTEFFEGISFIRNQTGLLTLLVTFTVINIMITPVFMLLPLVVIDPSLLGGSADMLAFIMLGSQVGSILSSLLLTRFKPFPKNVSGVVVGQIILYGAVFLMAMSAVLGNFYGMIISAFINGFGMPVANIHSQTIWQSVVPPELQGRVMAVRQTIAWVMIPFAQLVGGVLADIIGPIMVFIGGATLGLIFLIYSWIATGLPDVEASLGLADTITSPTAQQEPVTAEV